eukprot:NODE_106_length_2647_cov_74.886508_g102_i0.p1 GENE.NODE_106_length_2647_cov_74.886508_g102_i0~~NODE_106_length_2647_cov_74.886508_g102_i0.p1  ORF type:complete len:874 (-),score=211.74 NODE_106_length_2647_cov_74.886508_g102_i0:26-2608(-)
MAQVRRLLKKLKRSGLRRAVRRTQRYNEKAEGKDERRQRVRKKRQRYRDVDDEYDEGDEEEEEGEEITLETLAAHVPTKVPEWTELVEDNLESGPSTPSVASTPSSLSSDSDDVDLSQVKRQQAPQQPAGSLHMFGNAGGLMNKHNSELLRNGLAYDIPEWNARKLLQMQEEESALQYSGSDSDDDLPLLPNLCASTVQDRLSLARQKRQRLQCRKKAYFTQKAKRLDSLRELAASMRDQELRRHVAAMRTAMWLVLVRLGSRSKALREAPDWFRMKVNLTTLFVPMWYRTVYTRRKRWARWLLTQWRLPHMKRPTVAQLKSATGNAGTIFSNWPVPVLQSMIKKLHPVVYLQNEYLCYQDDPSQVMYFIMKGKVHVIKQSDEFPHSKSRANKGNNVVVTLPVPKIQKPPATMSLRINTEDENLLPTGKRRLPQPKEDDPVVYIGEYGVYADEPRSATLQAAERLEMWTITSDAFWFTLHKLPDDVLEGVQIQLEAQMEKLYPIRARMLKKLPMFAEWDDISCEMLVKDLESVVVRPKTVILQEGEPGDSMYFIGRGRVELIPGPAFKGSPAFEHVAGRVVKHSAKRASGKTLQTNEKAESTAKTTMKRRKVVKKKIDDDDYYRRILEPGATFGERACVFVERQTCTVRSIGTVQAWRLRKHSLKSLLLGHPTWFAQTKGVLNVELARLLPKPGSAPDVIYNSGLVDREWCPPELAMNIYKHMRPRVQESETSLAALRQPVTEVFFLLGGFAQATMGSGASGENMPEIKRYTQGNWLGVDFLLSQHPFWGHTVMVPLNRRCDLWYIPLDKVEACLLAFSNDPKFKALGRSSQRWRVTKLLRHLGTVREKHAAARMGQLAV